MITPHFYPHLVNMSTDRHKTRAEISDLFNWLTDRATGKWSMLVAERPKFLSSELVSKDEDIQSSPAVIIFTFELLSDATMFKLSFI